MAEQITTNTVDAVDAAGGKRASIRVEGVVKSFDGRVVVDVDDMTLGTHPVEGLIGPNGAGKTTLLRMIMHSIELDEGVITYSPPYSSAQGEVVLSGLPPHQIANLGVVKTNQVIQDFENLTIWDSLLLAAADGADGRLYRVFNEKELFDEHAERIRWYLDYFDFENPFGFARSAGEKKLLDIIRCMLLRPQVLLLDEPTAGLPEAVSDRLMELIRERATGDSISVVIVEHDLNVIWNMSDYVHFMAEGGVVLRGDPVWIREHETVVEKYLGSGHVGG